MQCSVIITDEGYNGLNPVQFGYEECNKGHDYGPAERTYWLIHFVASGFGYFKIGDKEYAVGPGEMFIIPPFEETYYKADEEKPWSYIWIGFTTDKALPAALTDIVRCPEAVEIFNAMKTCDKFSNGRSAFLSARLWDLFALLLGREKHHTDYVENALDCIHSEYMYGITVEQIAERLSLDRSYFSTLFKKKVGVSPKQYLLNYRMSIAASLMLDNGKSVTVAANSVGYTDIFTFSKMFKRHYGVSPNEYVSQKRKS
ncbi:MAG: AraC family transcriptional regulator [Clostridia bacterium]|nr:AraC family transcriptional regulator [Clostridia bacterium]